MPSLIGRRKKVIFNYLKERIWSRIQSWKNKPLSKTGREILIKAVAQSIPSYCMSVFLLPVSLAEEIQRMLNSFWWGSKKTNQRCIHWLSWDILSVRKEHGGLGFRNFHGFNIAMLGKQGWSFISSPDTLASRIFKAIYFPRGDFFSAQLDHNPSFVWKSIWSSQSLLKIGSRWKIGDGTNINVWQDPWLRDDDDFRIQTSMIPEMELLKVSNLMIPGLQQWDTSLINVLFNERDAHAILQIPLLGTPSPDTWVWHHSRNGKYTVRSEYWVISEIMSSRLDGGISGDWKMLWNLQVPPKVKNFLWRATRNCLLVRATIQHKGIPDPLTCVQCNGDSENTWHIFLICLFAQLCWSEVQLLSIINSCSSQVESFSELIFLMLKVLTTNEMEKAVMILWSLWRQRNEKLWNNTQSTSTQVVHYALQNLYDWLQAKGRRQMFHTNSTNAAPICKRWHKPPPHFLKCNTDAALFTSSNMFGLSCVLRDENGDFMACRMQHCDRNPTVKECEVLALLKAIIWINELNLENVIFELDAKTVVDAIKSPEHDDTEFGSIVHQCKYLLQQGTSFSVQFVYRQANVAAHALVQAARFFASSSICFEIQHCLIEHLDLCNYSHEE